MAKSTKTLDLSVFEQGVHHNELAKQRFHRQSAKVLRELARHLGYKAGDFDLRHNRAGIAVSGEIILHSDTLYVQLSQSAMGPAWGFMWRTCKGRRDYTGGTNQWMPWDRLYDLASVSQTMLAARG